MKEAEDYSSEDSKTSEQKRTSKLLQELLNSEVYKEVAKEMESNPIANVTREELLQQKKDEETIRIRGEIALCIIVIISAMAAFSEIKSLLMLLLISATGGIIGYFGDIKNPIPGFLGSFSMVILSSYTFDFYLSGRTSFIKIELLIPTFMAIIPAGIIYFMTIFLLILFNKSTKN